MNKKLGLTLLVLAVVVLLGYGIGRYAGFFGTTAPVDATSNTTTPPVATQPTSGWSTYTNDQLSIEYPDGYSVNSKYTYTALGPNKDIPGVSFTIPASLAAGTNLSKDTYLSVERLDSASCEAKVFIDNTQSTRSVEENGKTWSVAQGGGAGAGNFYDETVYAIKVGAQCYGLRLFIHSTNIGNYDPGTVREFDREALDEVFAQFRATFTIK